MGADPESALGSTLRAAGRSFSRAASIIKRWALALASPIAPAAGHFLIPAAFASPRSTDRFPSSVGPERCSSYVC